MPPASVRSAAVATIGALLLVSGAARADVVIHDGGVARDKDAVARVQERTGRRPNKVLPADVLAGPTHLLAAGASVEPCEGGTIRFDPRQRLDQITEQVLGFDQEGARASLEALDTLLPCSAEPLPKRILARAAFLRGAMFFDLADRPAATASMAEAAVLDAEYAGERGFPAAHLELLTAARAEILPGRLFVWTEPWVEEILIDGRTVEGLETAGVELDQGRHLIQFRGDHLQGFIIGVEHRLDFIFIQGRRDIMARVNKHAILQHLANE